MSSSSRRVVITGIGIVNPIGLDAASFWDSLSRGQSGIRAVETFDASGLPSRIAGEIRDFDAKNYIEKKDRKSLRLMARAIQLAVAAAQLAIDDSKVDKDKLDPTRFGVEFGAGLLPTELEELGAASQASVNCQPGSVDLEQWGKQGLGCIPPLWMLKYLPNMLACHVSIFHNAQGPNNTITEGDVAGLLALGESYRIIKRDQADFFLVGGADGRVNPLSMVRQCLFGHLSQRNESPESAVRPFDRGRDGWVISEGSGVLVLEEANHALARGARIYAEIVGFGAAFDRDTSGRGLARAIRTALKHAGIGPGDVDHVNAHGLSSIKSDAWESRALLEVFGSLPQPVPVFAPKSYFGNLSAGGSPTELAASLLGMEHGLVPATLNYTEPDPACPVNVIRSTQPMTKDYFIKIAFTEMGQCAVAVCKRWK
ncbi:MAG: beta-ketoacyl-[acyl-carrier-protein] synthase family protein [Planctomycetes bacterium]|nr:beta-ketoacyl-[acyl-carrier-protein] synthase family protein [Planctomycetota bacterium]